MRQTTRQFVSPNGHKMEGDRRPSLERMILVLHMQGFSVEDTTTCCRLMSHDVDADDVALVFEQLDQLRRPYTFSAGRQAVSDAMHISFREADPTELSETEERLPA